MIISIDTYKLFDNVQHSLRIKNFLQISNERKSLLLGKRYLQKNPLMVNIILNGKIFNTFPVGWNKTKIPL